MKRKYWNFVGISMIMLFFISFYSNASQENTVYIGTEGESGKTNDLSKVDEAKDCVVQIVVQYIDEDGNKYLLKSGSGFLINDAVVLTNYHNVTLTDQEKNIASQYISQQTGKTVDFNSNQGSQAAYQIGVAVYRDVVFYATINAYSSKEMDLAILNITDNMNREKATLGNSDEVENYTEIFALGYKAISVMSSGTTELLSQTDCREEAGILNQMVTDSRVKYMDHTCRIHEGNTGGPIVDRNGNVVGMSIYQDTEAEMPDSYRALTINEIKGLLDNCEIAYQEAGLFSVTNILVEEVEEETVKEVDTNLLDTYIVNFNMLEQSNYTSESFAALRAALEKAREVKSDKLATQEEIDAAVTQLEVARAGLVMAQKVNWPFIVVMILLGVLVIGALLIYILYLKGVIGKKGEQESFQTLQEITNRSKESLNGQSANLNLMPPKKGSISKQLNNRMQYSDNGAGTTVLGSVSAQSEGTVVLGVSNNRGNAYLTRLKTSERICIDRNEFIIGKGISTTNYCIKDNATISREHAKIFRNASAYYLVDLNSTNSTYLNEKLLRAGEEEALSNGSVLRLSDEEFVFHEC